MIIARLMGGLGNQMFQYANAIAYQKRVGASKLLFDISMLSGSTYFDGVEMQRNMQLDQVFDVVIDLATARDLARFVGRNHACLLGRMMDRALIKLWRNRFIAERRDRYDERVLLARDRTCLYGAWQSERYFEDAVQDVRSLLRFRGGLSSSSYELGEEIANANSVCIHVRRQDYVDSPRYSRTIGALNIQYYRRLVDLIEKRIESPRYFVFSDDLAWCRKHFDNGRFRLVEDEHMGTNCHKCMQLMTKCKHFVMSNSTFCWWAVWLGEKPESVVFAPAPWVRNGTRNPLILPKRWQTCEASFEQIAE
jgi:hypothetical protein